MCRSEEKPAPTSSMASRMPRGAERGERGVECVVVLDLVVLGELEQDPRSSGSRSAVRRIPGSAGWRGRRSWRRSRRRRPGARRPAPARAARTGRRGRCCAPRRSTTSGALPQSAGNRLSASAPIRAPVARSTMGWSTTTGPPAAITGPSRSSISARAPCARTSGSMMTAAAEREHVHQRLVALGQVLVGGQAGGAEGAVQRRRRSGRRAPRRSCAAAASGGRELHRLGENLEVGDDRGQLPVEDRLASVASCRWVCPPGRGRAPTSRRPRGAGWCRRAGSGTRR